MILNSNKEIKDIATDYIKSHGGYQRRKHLFLNGGLLSVEDLQTNFGFEIFKILGVRMIKIPGEKTKNFRYTVRPKLNYSLNSEGKITKITSHGIEINHNYDSKGNLVKTISTNEFSRLNDNGRKIYGLTGYHVVKSKHICNSKKIYKYGKKNKLTRIITYSGPEKYDFNERYQEEWIKDDEIFHTIKSNLNSVPKIMRNLNFYLFYNLKSLKAFKMWKHIKKIRNTEKVKKKFILFK